MKEPVRLPTKAAVRDALIRALEEQLAKAVASFTETKSGATHEENKQEGDKDMRATEQSYLARGQAMRAEGLAEELQRARLMELPEFSRATPIAIGALVVTQVDDEPPRTFFVAAQGGGTELLVDGTRVTVVTPASPLGAVLSGKLTNDDFEFRTKGTLQEWIILHVV